MGDQIRIPSVELTYFFLYSLSNAIFKTAELPALCDVVSSISELFVPHFAMSAFTCINAPINVKPAGEGGRGGRA